MYKPVVTAATTTRGGTPTDNVDYVVNLDQIPRWSDTECRSLLEYESEDTSFSNSYFADPLTSQSEAEGGGSGFISSFPVDHEINSKIYL